MRKGFLSIASLSIVMACAPAAPKPADPAVAAAAVSKLSEDYVKAYAAKDTAAIAKLFTDDAVVMGGDTTSMVGKAAIMQSFIAEFAMPMLPTVAINGTPVFSTDDYVVSEGTVDVTMAMPGSEPVVEHGKWMSVSQRQADSTWKMSRLIYNSNSAARPMMAAMMKMMTPAAPAKKP